MNMKRKLLSLVMAVSMMATMSATAFASNDETLQKTDETYSSEFVGSTIELDALPTNFDFALAEEDLNETATLGMSEVMKRSYKQLQLTQYYQTNSSWSNELMQTLNLTIGNSGCALTSFAMIQQFLGSSATPSQVNARLGTSACPIQYYEIASKYNLTVSAGTHGTVSDSTAINYCVGKISLNQPVLVGLINSSGSTHFVAASGYSGSTVYIKDTITNGKSTLNQYLSSGYSVHRLYTYS